MKKGMNGNETLIKRAHVLLECLRERMNEEVSEKDIETLLNKKLGDSIGWQTIRKIAFYMKNINIAGRGFDVHVSDKKSTVRLEQMDLTRFGRRSSEYPAIKSGLGFALWHWL